MDEPLKILQQFSEYLSLSNLLVYLWRKFAWACLRSFKLVLDAAESLLNAVYKLVDFGDSAEVKAFVSDNKVAIFSAGTVCLIIFCISFMKNSKKATPPTLMNNMLLGIGVVLMSLSLTYTITKGSFTVAKAIYSGDSTTADQIFNSNIYDVTTFDSFNWESTKKVKSIHYDEEALKAMDITAEVFPKKLSPKNEVTSEVFNNKRIVDTEGKQDLEKLDRGLFQMDENYYRYSWHPWIILFQMIAMLVVLFAASFKYTKSIFNSAYNGIIAPFFAFSDLIEASRVQKILTGIVNTGINIILFAISLMVYRLLSAYTGTVGINAVQQVILQLFLAFIVVEGPFIIQELTGQDGGVRSEAKAIVGSAVGAAFLGKKAGGAIKDGFNNAKDKVKKGANFAGGLVQGAYDSASGKDTLEEDMNAAKETGNNAVKPPTNPSNELNKEEKEAFDNEVKENLSTPDKKETAPSIEENDQLSETTDGLNDARDSGMPKPIEGLEDISATPAGLEKEMSEAKEKAGEIPGVQRPSGSMALASPIGNETAAAFSTTDNGMNLTSQRAINSAIQGNSKGTPMANISSFPSNVQSMPGVHEVQQGGFLAPMRVPSSARMNQALSPELSSGGSLSPVHSAFVSQQAPVGPMTLQASVPAGIHSLPGVQQYQQDLKNSGVPLTTETLPEVIANKWADRQISQAEKRKTYQEYHQLGRNTGKKALDNFTPRKERTDD